MTNIRHRILVVVAVSSMALVCVSVIVIAYWWNSNAFFGIRA